MNNFQVPNAHSKNLKTDKLLCYDYKFLHNNFTFHWINITAIILIICFCFIPYCSKLINQRDYNMPCVIRNV